MAKLQNSVNRGLIGYVSEHFQYHLEPSVYLDNLLVSLVNTIFILYFRLRDISFSLYLLNDENNKSLTYNINWDANRDPNQKLMLTANYRKNAAFDYLANFILSYPGRTVKGDYKFLLESKLFQFYILAC